MKKLFLFPRKFRVIGLIVLIPAIALYIANAYYGFTFDFLNHSNSKGVSDNNWTDDLSYLLLLLSLSFIAFSNLKVEDELSIQLRFQSFQITTYISLILFMGLDLFTFNLTYVFCATYLWYLFIVLFIIIFYAKNYLLTKSAKNEK